MNRLALSAHAGSLSVLLPGRGKKKKKKMGCEYGQPRAVPGKGEQRGPAAREGHQQPAGARQHVGVVSGGAEVLSHSGTGAEGPGDAMGKSCSPPATRCSISRLGNGASRQVEQGFEASQALPRFAPFPWLRNLAEGGVRSLFFIIFFSSFIMIISLLPRI